MITKADAKCLCQMINPERRKEPYDHAAMVRAVKSVLSYQSTREVRDLPPVDDASWMAFDPKSRAAFIVIACKAMNQAAEQLLATAGIFMSDAGVMVSANPKNTEIN